MAVKEAMARAQPALVEPVMRIDVNVAEENVGVVTSDIGRRRGAVKAMNVQGGIHHVVAEAPLAEMFGYATALRSMTSGRATFTLEFQRYDFVPGEIAQAIVKQRHADGEVKAR